MALELWAELIAHGVPIEGNVRFNCYCQGCLNSFIARINFSLDGQHIIKCPFCHHEHCRHIENGVMKSDKLFRDDGPPRIDAKTYKVDDGP